MLKSWSFVLKITPLPIFSPENVMWCVFFTVACTFRRDTSDLSMRGFTMGFTAGLTVGFLVGFTIDFIVGFTMGFTMGLS